MAKKVALPRLIAGVAVALAMFMTVKVEAVTLTITAAAVCSDTGGWDINYTASVTGNGSVSNPSVNILFDGVVVDNGAFVGPTFSFDGTAPSPPGKVGGDTVVVSLNVVGIWSNGTLPGEAANTASTEVTLPSDCTPPSFGGCTPGYWKAEQHFDSWVDPYDPEDLFNDLPGFTDVPEFDGLTLLDVLSLGGGGLNALGRHTVAALLNSAGGFGVDLTALQIAFNAAIASGDYEPLKDVLDFLNNAGCPLS